jgi:hypothetical protein
MIWEDNGHILEELIHYARKTGFLEVFIFTNGTTLLTIKQCNCIVTIDGPKDIHNQIRRNTYYLIIMIEYLHVAVILTIRLYVKIAVIRIASRSLKYLL